MGLREPAGFRDARRARALSRRNGRGDGRGLGSVAQDIARQVRRNHRTPPLPGGPRDRLGRALHARDRSDVGAELDAVALLRLTASVAAVIALPALAHEGDAGSVVTAGLRWSFEPWVVVPLALSAVLYAVGVQRLWQRAGRPRGITF